jgi:hypothetical protein
MKYEELREAMRRQAYLGWMMYLMQPVGKRGSSKMSLEEWLRNFDLLDDKRSGEKTQEDVESMKKKSLEIANKIIAMDRKSRK